MHGYISSGQETVINSLPEAANQLCAYSPRIPLFDKDYWDADAVQRDFPALADAYAAHPRQVGSSSVASFKNWFDVSANAYQYALAPSSAATPLFLSRLMPYADIGALSGNRIERRDQMTAAIVGDMLQKDGLIATGDSPADNARSIALFVSEHNAYDLLCQTHGAGGNIFWSRKPAYARPQAATDKFGAITAPAQASLPVFRSPFGALTPSVQPLLFAGYFTVPDDLSVPVVLAEEHAYRDNPLLTRYERDVIDAAATRSDDRRIILRLLAPES